MTTTQNWTLRTMRFAGVTVALLAGTLAAAAPASAMDACTGTLAAGLMRPLPYPTIVRVAISNNSERNVALARQFTSGMEKAGVSTNGTPTAVISITAQFTTSGGNTSGSGGSGGSGGGPRAMGDFNFGNVGNQMTLPNLDSGRLIPRPGGEIQNALFLRAELRDAAGKQTLWIATVSCTVQTSDDGQLANQIGQLIGGVLGKRVERTKF